MTSVALTVIMVSLIGLPPLAGFVGKFAIFAALVDAGGPWMIGLLVIAGINTAISLIYYLRVAKVMCIDPEPASRRPAEIGFLPAVYVLLISLPVVIYGIFPGRVLEFVEASTRSLL
jgi:NADH-quinone oxidoreductase subunit N